ncbi:UGSC family (seleno)protein, partial [Chloroflexota bacterium]
VVMVNGPISEEIGIGCEQGAAGKGYHANGSLGYAINLIAYTVGGSKPPTIDKSTLASPSDYVCWVFGENEASLPPGWEPLHVDQGFKKADSVVTVMCSYPPIENIDHWSINTEEHLRWWSYLVNPIHNIGGSCKSDFMKQSPIVALGPEHAQLIASKGWTKDKFRQELWKQSRIPLSAYPSQCAEMEILEDTYGPVTSESIIPITIKPEQFLIVIAGGVGKHSHYFPPFFRAFPASRLIKK